MASTPKANGKTAKTATMEEDYITVVEVDDPTSSSEDRLKNASESLVGSSPWQLSFCWSSLATLVHSNPGQD